ncbi:head protein [Myxococcus llanfairpwllgwyngyllgogerychwyrndrobwllllantysiliogogogochensis]|uniref:Head protein n=2 Tax=Myxococcus llanfairpwllgwyngyllgogerychwyrndrobwllllantysiliogogogochensis TaxID=2590453 RepID=A0A540X0F9_9BACT|nr:head protein [Myxococcus llanfairpwllgwyngyllgogerychwyrndrobwllllantysiliogogogochensis]
MKLLEVQEVLGRLRHESHSPEEKEKLNTAMEVFEFIFETGQAEAVDDYRQSLEARAPPLVSARFDTREEAMAWLHAHPAPLNGAKVLVGDEYFNVVHFRDGNFRRLPPSPVLEFYLQDIEEEGLPPPVATFDTVEQAQAWVDSQPEPPRQVLILINGAPHLVAYHYRVNVRAIYPMSLAAKAAPAPADEPAD